MFILGSLRTDALVLLFPIWSGRDDGRWKNYIVVRKLVDCEIRVLLLSFSSTDYHAFQFKAKCIFYKNVLRVSLSIHQLQNVLKVY